LLATRHDSKASLTLAASSVLVESARKYFVAFKVVDLRVPSLGIQA
jgi:hypothetical protein